MSTSRKHKNTIIRKNRQYKEVHKDLKTFGKRAKDVKNRRGLGEKFAIVKEKSGVLRKGKNKIMPKHDKIMTI